jgi:hypothetical protein
VRDSAVLATTCVVAAGLLAGCGGSSGDDDSSGEKKAEKQLANSAAPTPVCVDQAKAAGTKVMPTAFPTSFPMPEGSVVYATQHRSEGRTIVYAVVDSDVKTVLHGLQTALPEAGFTPKEGEVEEHDAESNWTGNGFTGRWAIRQVAGCAEQTSVTVLSARG